MWLTFGYETGSLPLVGTWTTPGFESWRDGAGQGRASYLWTWKWNCFPSVFTFSWGILALWIRERWFPSSMAGGQVRLMDRSTSASRREIISCLWATSLGMDSDLLPSQASTHFFFFCCWGAQPPGVAWHPPTPSLFCPSDTTQAGLCLTGLLLHDQGRDPGLNQPRWLQMWLLSVAISKILFGSLKFSFINFLWLWRWQLSFTY